MEQPAPDFSEIYASYLPRVLEDAAKLIGRDEADDVAQEVFIKVNRNLGALRDRAKLTSWIFAITINTVRDLARRRAVRGESSTVGPAGGQTDRREEDPLAQLEDHRSRSPEEKAIRNEMVRCYLDYVEKLPPDHQEIYVLREFGQLSNEEIAGRLSLSLDTVKIRLHRAREKLYDQLRKNCRCYLNERGELMGEPRED